MIFFIVPVFLLNYSNFLVYRRFVFMIQALILAIVYLYIYNPLNKNRNNLKNNLILDNVNDFIIIFIWSLWVLYNYNNIIIKIFNDSFGLNEHFILYYSL